MGDLIMVLYKLRDICRIYAHKRNGHQHDGCEGWHGNGSWLMAVLQLYYV